jgi:leucyl aminopeptidase
MKIQLSLGFVLSGLLIFAGAAPARIPSSEIQAKTAQGLRLVSLADNAPLVWKSEDEKLDLIRQNKHFVRRDGSRCLL